MTYIHILDLIGVFAFAVYGAHKAILARFDLFGLLACGALTAFGGGTIRELLLHGTPAYFYDYSYLVAAMVGVACAIAIHRQFARIEKYLLIVDAIGLAVFAYVGALRAESAHFGLAAIVLCATLTGVGGGILSDMVSGRKPEALYKDAYPLAPMVLAVVYFYVRPVGHDVGVGLTLIALGFMVRVISLHLTLTLWRPYHQPRQQVIARLGILPVHAD